MELKKEKRVKFRLLKSLKYKKITLILLFLLIITISSLYGMYYGITHRIELNILWEEMPHKMNNIPNWIKGQFSNPDTIIMDIKYQDYLILAYNREIALEKGVLLRSPNDTVPATIRYKDQNLKADVRLKGDWVIDHLTGDKWSFRIKIKGNETLLGMREFSIQRPGSRNYIYEWIFHKGLKREGLIGLRYKFINVILNGKNLGIYALEEHFDKYLIESNNRREGPIIRFNEDLTWNIITETPQYFSELEESIFHNIYTSTPIDPFNPNRISKNQELSEQYYEAKNLLESFRSRKLKASNVFDIDKYATFMAFADLMGAQHAQYLSNMRFYYNPITSKLEPIGFDAEPGIEKISSLVASPTTYNELFIETLFQDKAFLEKYIQELERLSNKEYLDTFLSEINDELQANLNIIYKDYPSKEFNKEIFYNNQQFIREMLNPIEGIYAYYKSLNNNILEVYIGNIQSIPIIILNANYKETPLKSIFEDSFLEGKKIKEPVEYKIFRFKVPENTDIKDLSINYKLFGTSRIRTQKVIPWPYLNVNFLEEPNIRNSNLALFDFIKIDNSTKIISIAQGEWNIDKNMIIPPNHIFKLSKGTTLNLLNNSKIISYSPLSFVGTEENPIKINGGQGLTVLNAKENSLLKYVIFNNLSETHEGRWKLTGSITFYESPIYIHNCQFSNSNSEDSLNIVRSEFEIKDSFFENSYSDMIDFDFSKGLISHSSFNNCGNDCLDFSGSNINLDEIYINKANDKGISVGENTQLNAKNIHIKNSRIGLASKDMSHVEINNIEISNSEFGFAIYQKKPEFGPAEISASTVNIINTPYNYIIEEGSKLSIDKKEIKEKVSTSKITSLNFW